MAEKAKAIQVVKSQAAARPLARQNQRVYYAKAKAVRVAQRVRAIER